MQISEIKDLRTKLELSQEKMAQVLGVSLLTVSRWENGKSKPSQMAIYRLKELQRAKR